MNEKTLVINSKPVPQARPRFTVRGSHAFAWDAQKDLKNWYRLQIAEAMGLEPLICEPVNIVMTFYMPIPKSTSKKRQALMLKNEIKHVKHTGDIDNLMKIFFDCMNNIVFEDDSQIWRVEAQKIYSDTPRIEIVIQW